MTPSLKAVSLLLLKSSYFFLAYCFRDILLKAPLTWRVCCSNS